MTEPNKPLNQMTAQERLDLGRSYFKEGKFDEAITLLQTIVPTEDSPTYTEAQLGLGLAYEFKGNINKAISAWLNIHREDNPKAYAWAQFRLGFAYEIQDRLDECISAWSNIDRKDDPEVYAKAQLNLGATYYAQGKLDDAITAWSNIHREDDPETYAKAQLNLGNAYEARGKLDDAITAWSNIHREDNPETYAKAQLNLGLAYEARGKLDDAITAWKKVREDNPETYAKAQLNLGVIYKDLAYKDKDEDQRKLDEAIAAWSNIHREEVDPETYARAQFNLGLAYHTQGKLDEAITAWSNIHREDDPKAYARAQFNLGLAYEDQGNLDKAKEAYRNAREFHYYKSERKYRILECPPEFIENLRGIADNTDEVRKSLQIIPDFESKVAHYSRASTAFSLFGDEKNDKEPSNFRLSTIRGVNDPTEGLVLNDYWDQQGIPETIHTNDTATFISCFTFNHDSLNQFRLYGKENGREATGVSLVFKEEFFSDQSDTLEFIAAPSIDPPSKLGKDSSNETEKSESNKLIGKSTLYRCIYLDPETGYLTLAQRDKSTFYRENKKAAKDQWDKYSTKISGIKGSVKNCLFDDNNSVLSMLKSISKELEESNAPEESHTYSIEEKQKILEAIRFILLPLQYLVKHIAFQEEQECRIMYTTHLHDEKIHHDWKTQEMYVEYEEHVLPHIDKIYLSPGSAKYQDFFRILLDQKEDDEPDKKEDENESKVRISQNPFRNKE